jgi:hypothetical protein
MSNTPEVRYSFTPDSVNLYYKGISKLFASETPEYNQVKEILKSPDADNRKTKLLEFFEALRAKPVPQEEKIVENRDYIVKDNDVYINDGQGNFTKTDKVIGDRVKQFAAEGLPYSPLLNLWNRLVKNVSYGSKHRLYAHMERHHHALLPDGRFIAYKRVTSDFKDFWTRTFDNSIGAKPTVDRGEVDDDARKNCSFGLHISSYNYAKNRYHSGEGVLIEVAVDPADVVSVTFDEGMEKMRVTSYEVLAVCEEERKEQLADHKANHGFRVDPDADLCCPFCHNHEDYCVCVAEDYCDNCSELLDDCDCEDDEEFD